MIGRITHPSRRDMTHRLMMLTNDPRDRAFNMLRLNVLLMR